jgi:hypothetical protein
MGNDFAGCVDFINTGVYHFCSFYYLVTLILMPVESIDVASNLIAY